MEHPVDPQARLVSEDSPGTARGEKKRGRRRGASDESAATVGYEAQLWQMADALRGSMDAAEYKHVVLGLIFLKYISDSFEEMFSKLQKGEGEYAGADPEDKDEYKAENVFWVPPAAR